MVFFLNKEAVTHADCAGRTTLHAFSKLLWIVISPEQTNSIILSQNLRNASKLFKRGQ